MQPWLLFQHDFWLHHCPIKLHWTAARVGTWANHWPFPVRLERAGGACGHNWQHELKFSETASLTHRHAGFIASRDNPIPLNALRPDHLPAGAAVRVGHSTQNLEPAMAQIFSRRFIVRATASVQTEQQGASDGFCRSAAALPAPVSGPCLTHYWEYLRKVMVIWKQHHLNANKSLSVFKPFYSIHFQELDALVYVRYLGLES